MPLDSAGYSEAFAEAMSPSMFAATPPELPTDDTAPGKNWDSIYAHLESRMGMLRTARWSWWAHWSELARWLLPRRYFWFITANLQSRGLPINQDIVDGTPTAAMQTCAAGAWTGLTSPSRPWFKLGLSTPGVALDAEGAAWLYDTEQRLYAVFAGSNFYSSSAQMFQDVTTFGTSPMLMYEDSEDVIRCYLPCAGEYFLAAGGRLSDNVLFREYVRTVSQIVDEFQLENCPEQIRKAWKEGGGSLELEFVVAHAVEPNFALADRLNGKKSIRVVPGSFPYREVYWLRGIKTSRELRRTGYYEKPFFAARWYTVSNDAYGRSPGMDALGDIKQLQLETRRKAEFIEKLVRPPMGADRELKNEPNSVQPGHVTYMSTDGGKKNFWPLFEVNAQALAPMIQDIEKISARIEKWFYVPVFMAISQMEGVQPRNELEINKRDLERLQVLGPFINLFETEFAGPAVMRCMNILERRRALKPRPASLQGQPLKIEYLSMLKLVQQAAETTAMGQGLAIAGSMSEAAKAAGVPDPIRIIDLGAALRIYFDRIHFPAVAMYSPAQVADHDRIRAAAQQQHEAMQATQPVVSAAQTLSQTPIGGGQSALQAMLGGGGRG